MTDRELLEMAAKAAGVEYDPKQFSQFGLWLVIHGEPSEYQRRYWNPLKDDGDALRLAVKLNLIVECMRGQSAARTFDSKHGGACDFPAARPDGCRRDHEPDQYAATRRSIVRAAAEIGKAML